MNDLLFSGEGRIGRGQFWKTSIVLALVVMAVMTVANLVIAQFVPNGSGEDGTYSVEGTAALPFLVVNALVMIPSTWAGICLGIKRFHDRGKSGAWVLILFVPFIGGVWYLVETGFLRGTAGPNRYGPDPLANAGVATPIAYA